MVLFFFGLEEICGKYEDICRKYEEIRGKYEEILEKYEEIWRRHVEICINEPFSSKHLRVIKRVVGLKIIQGGRALLPPPAL